MLLILKSFQCQKTYHSHPQVLTQGFAKGLDSKHFRLYGPFGLCSVTQLYCCRVKVAICCSVAKLCPTPCEPMECSTPGFPVFRHLQEFAQTYVHWISDAIQPSRPLSSPSPPAFNLSQHQGLFKWVSSLHEVAKGLEFQLQHQSFQWTPRTGWISLQSKGLSRVFSNTTVWKHQFFGAQTSLWSSSHMGTRLLEKP